MVWEARSREAPPYPDLWPVAEMRATRHSDRFWGAPVAEARQRKLTRPCVHSLDPKETPSKQGARKRLSAAVAGPNRRSLDDEGWLEGHGPGHVVEVGRGRHHRLVDLGELFLGAAALDADDVLISP